MPQFRESLVMLYAFLSWTEIVGVLCVLLLAYFLYFSKKLVVFFIDYKQKLKALENVGCDKLYWLLGHLPILAPTQKSMMYSLALANKFPKCMQLWFGPLAVYLSCHHPDILKPILATDEGKDDLAYRFLIPWIGDGLLLSRGTKWKRNRRLLTPAFHFDMLKYYLAIFNRSSHELLQKWSDCKKEIVQVEMFRDVSRMTLDALLQCLISKKSNCQQACNSQYLDSVCTITEISMKRIFSPIYHIDWVFYLSPMGWKYRKALRIAHEYTEKAVLERKAVIGKSDMDLDGYIALRKEQRERGEDVTLDFLDILLLSKDESGVGLGHSEVCDEVDTFVFEGHDTTASGISWAFYNLAANPKHQDLCRKEVQALLGDRDHVEFEDLSKLTYLTMCIKESLRLHPPVFSIARKTTKPLFLPRGFGFDHYNTVDQSAVGVNTSRTMPKNMNIGLTIFILHRHPDIWKNPGEYDPERFTADNIAKRPPHAYLPFSSGPRNCIGQHFAMNEMKVVLALALSRFRFSVDESYPAPELEPHIILRAKNGIHLKFEKLQLLPDNL